MNVLIVDDEASIRRMVSDFLTDCGHQVMTAEEGAEALGHLEESRSIDAVLTDVRMPRMNGLDLLRTVRVRHPGLPVILMTGHGDESVAASALQHGAHDYLTKPVSLAELMQCLERLQERQDLEAQMLADFRTARRGGELAGSAPEPATRSRGEFLIVSENAGRVEPLCQNLHDHGHGVHTVTTATAARRRFGEASTDVVFTDVELSDGDGIELAAELRDLDPTIVPVIIARDPDRRTLTRAMEAGAAGCLQNPQASAEALRLIGRALAERKRLVDTRVLLGDLLQARSELQARAVERERYLSHLIDSAPFGVVSTDESGAILTYNGKAETMLGHSEDEMRGGDIQRLLATPLDTRGLQPGATPARCELLHRDGTRVPVLIHSSEIRDSGRSLRARLHVLEDRTEREQVESQLLQAERLSVLGQMAPRLAHEFKTPLQVVMGNADLATLALDGDDLDDCRHCMEEIGPAVEQMNGLVRQMLDLGKPQKSRVEAIDLADEIAKLLGVLRPLRVLQACSVSTDFDNRLPSVLGDPAQIEQVLRNLIVNAAQAMEDGDDPRLELSLRADNAQRVVVTIRDSGCGIPAPDLEQIFQPFYTTKPEGKGTGLGLPIVKTILDRHGATIDVTSTPGAGTVFTIAFPAVHSDPPDEDTTLLEVAS